MLGRRGRAERRYRVGDAVLMQANRIHIAFNDDEPLEGCAGLPRFPQSIELTPLVEERGLRGVQVFRLALVDDPPAEGNDAPARIANREHEPVAEPVVVPLALTHLPAVALDHEPHLRQ